MYFHEITTFSYWLCRSSLKSATSQLLSWRVSYTWGL